MCLTGLVPRWPSSSTGMSTITQNVYGGVFDGGAVQDNLADDAGERRRYLRVDSCDAASRQSAAVGRCGTCMTDHVLGGLWDGWRVAGRLRRVRAAAPPPALRRASCADRSCSLDTHR
jgi:hypothetical protein